MPVAEDRWYTRPIFSVSSVDQALQHYCELPGFEQARKYGEHSKTLETQVSRSGFELILAGNLDRVGADRVIPQYEYVIQVVTK